MEPPNYASTLPRISKPAYDIMEPQHEKLPPYTPHVYKVGILYRKMEWISPYEMANQRHWKPYIVELNSTQLNIYKFPFKQYDESLRKLEVASSFSDNNSSSLLHPYHHHHLYLKRIKGIKAPSAVSPGASCDYNEDNYRSVMTTKTDLKALRYFRSINALDSINIVRSYSLQYGRIGLAIDYKKKNRVFRCRLETEQFLLDFQNSEGMIEWYNAINLGIDGALDLSRRDMPNYRTVPRRRTRRYRNHNAARHVAFSLGLNGSHLVDEYAENASDRDNHGRRGSTKKLERKTASRSLLSSKSIENLFKIGGRKKNTSAASAGVLNVSKKNVSKSSSTVEKTMIGKSTRDNLNGIDEITNGVEESHINSTGLNLGEGMFNADGMPIDEDGFEVFEEDELVDDDEDEFDLGEGEYGNGEVVDGEEESESEQGGQQARSETKVVSLSPTSGNSVSSQGRSNEFSTPSSTIDDCVNKNVKFIEYGTGNGLSDKGCKIRQYEEYLSKPSGHSINSHTYQGQRKILRDSLRCMVPLTENERWAGKFVLLDSNKKYKPQSKECVDHHYQSLEVLTHVGTVGPNYVHKFRRPLQEWIVTPSGLIPYMNPNCGR